MGVFVLRPGGPLCHRLLPAAKRQLVSTCRSAGERNFDLPVPFASNSPGYSPLWLLVDSGADDSFIDESLARQAGLPLEALSEPKMVLDLDGRALA